MNGILVSAVYEKLLRLSPRVSKDFGPGYINTLIGADISVVREAQNYIINFIGFVVQLTLAIFFLFQFLGWLAASMPLVLFAGLVAFEIRIMPQIAVKARSYHQAMDSRSKTLREFLYGIKFIKFQALEDFFASKINTFRNDQLVASSDLMRIFATFYASGSMRQYLLPTISILAYALLYNLNPTKAATASSSSTSWTVFTALALLDAIAGPAGAMNATLGQLMRVPVSYKRLTDYLLADEMRDDEKPEYRPRVHIDADGKKPATGAAAVVLENAGFTWETVKGQETKAKKPVVIVSDPKKPTTETTPLLSTSQDTSSISKPPPPAVFQLQSISLSIPAGALVAVVGGVGSGKSSLLAALAGHMRKTTPTTTAKTAIATLYGSIAYCPQEPWILSGTIEDNICFGDQDLKRWHKSRISNAVQVIDLEKDLELMPYGLGTNIGEKGINLSGGQRSRVALGRWFLSYFNFFFFSLHFINLCSSLFLFFFYFQPVPSPKTPISTSLTIPQPR
jgi:ABC-type multidrug transport system fused ATPase/permease subunit